jgi:hypothetical protein
MLTAFIASYRRMIDSRSLVAAVGALAFIVAGAGAASAATVTINGTPVKPVYERSGHLLVPFRAPMEQLGAKVDWQAPTATATMNGEQLVTIHIDDSNATIKGNPRKLSVAPELIDNLAYVPVEALADISNAKVEYASDRHSATVTNWDLAGISAIAALAGGATKLDSNSNPTPYYYGGYPGPPTWFWILAFSSIVSALVVFMADAAVRGSKRS